MKKSIPSGPWIVTGMSKHGPWIKVRGTALGDTFKIANVPFTATESQFCAVEDAEKIAHAISLIPDMVRLLKQVPNGSAEMADRADEVHQLLTSIGEM
jgi:hypothetical protein